MAEYISAPIEVEADDYADAAYDAIQEIWPDWEPNEANLEVALIEASARMAAELARLASDVPMSIFRWFGASVLDMPPGEATAATADTTWTMIDNAGYTIPAGTVVGINSDGDTIIAFETVDDVTVPAGQTQTAPGEVLIQAQDEGIEGTGLGTAGGPVQLIDALDFVGNITLVGPTAGGADAEDDALYLHRLRTRLQLLTPRPILDRDFAILAQDTPGVDRAAVLDNYKPGPPWHPDPPDTQAERTVTVIPIDAAGEAVGTATRNAVDTDLQAQREINFQVFVIDPTHTPVDVTYAGVCEPGWDPAVVQAALDEVIANFLNPAEWGLPSSGEFKEWILKDTVRYLDLAAAIDRVEGFDYLTNLTIGLDGGAQGPTDATLPGEAPLPRPGAINGAVVAP